MSYDKTSSTNGWKDATIDHIIKSHRPWDIMTRMLSHSPENAGYYMTYLSPEDLRRYCANGLRLHDAKQLQHWADNT